MAKALRSRKLQCLDPGQSQAQWWHSSTGLLQPLRLVLARHAPVEQPAADYQLQRLRMVVAAAAAAGQGSDVLTIWSCLALLGSYCQQRQTTFAERTAPITTTTETTMTRAVEVDAAAAAAGKAGEPSCSRRQDQAGRAGRLASCPVGQSLQAHPCCWGGVHFRRCPCAS